MVATRGRIYRVAHVAQRLGVHRTTFIGWLHRADFPIQEKLGMPIGNGEEYVFDDNDVVIIEEWCKRTRNHAT